MSLNRGRKLKIILTAFVICGAFLFILPVNNAFAYHSTSTYDKPANGTLSANEWNNLLFDNSGSRGVDNLFGDFVNTWLPAKMNGPLGIATSSPADSGVMLDVNGYVRATGFIGPMASFLSARSVSSGEFGFSTGGGNYTFGVTNPGFVGIGVALPQYNLDVSGKTRFSIGEDADSFVIRSNPDAANRFRVDNDIKNVLLQEDGGLVGIGTSSPNALLDVNGLIKMRTGTIIASEDVINKGYLDSAIALATSSVITQVATSSFWQGSLTGNVWNANTGNIGIGTTNPRAPLEIYRDGAGNIGSFLLDQPTVPTGSTSKGPHFFFKSGGIDRGWFGFFDSVAHGSGTALNLRSAGDVRLGASVGNTPDMIIKVGGNVGIGTTNPIHKFQISGGNVSLSDGYYIDWGNGSTRITSLQPDANNRHMGFQTWNNVTGLSEKMRITSTGSVGIGTTNPGTKLEITNQAAFNAVTPGTILYGLHFSGQATADYANGITWNGGSTGAQAGIYVQGSGAYGTKMYFATTDVYVTGAKTRMMIDHVGNVGIGTTAPNDRFSIGNSGSAPAGSSNTGHNYTSTYLSSDDYALANYGLVKTLISAATSSSALWGGTTGGNIWSLNSANVGIGTTNPTNGKLQIGAGGSATTLAISLGAMNTYSSIQTYNSSLSLNSAGNNVGIGTTSPVNKLDVVGNQGLSGTLVLNNPVASQNGYNIKNLTIMSDPFYNSAIIGYDYDALVNADKKYTITFTGGFVGSNAALLFDGNTGSAISSTAATTGTIEVNLINMQHYFYALTLNSPWGTGYGFSSSFLIEKYYDPNSGNGWDSNCDNSEGDLVWATISDVTGFAGSQYVTRTGLSNGICRIRVTFRDFTGTTSQIQVGDLSLYQFYYGYKGLSAKTNGDTLFGDYDFSDSVIRVHIDNSTGNSFFNGGNFGVGTTAPNDKFSIGSGGGIAAPAGSSNTGHNYTSTYLSSDDYALANYGIVKTMIASATSTMPGLWGGTLGGAIWSLNTGYVGIGVSNPASKLDLAGDLRITPSGSSGGIFFAGTNATRLYSDTGTAGLWLINATSSRMFLGTGWNYDVQVGFDYTPGTTGAGAGRLVIGQTNKNAGTYTHGITSLYTNGLERMRINVDGNVGIGTTNPIAKLQSSSAGASASVPAAGTIDNSTALFLTNGNGSLYGLLGGVLGSGNAWLQAQRTDASATTYSLLLNPNGGNVGIGTTAPLAKLHAVAADGTNNMGYNFIFDNQDVNAAHSNGLLVKGGADSNAAIIFAAQDYSGNNDFVIRGSGYVGVGITNPNDIFSIGNAGSAPAGSSNTGHNYTSTYLSSDDYALANYGVVKTLIASATSSSGLWMGVKNGNIWNGDAGAGNVGIGTTTPAAKLDIANNSVEKSLNISLTGSYSAVDSTYGVYVLNNRGGSQNNPSRYGGYFEAQSYTSSSNYNYGVVGVANKIGGYGHTATGVLGIGRHTYTSYATVASTLIGVQGQVDFADDSVALTNSTFGASFYANANIPTNKTLASYYGLYLNSPTGAGTITNKFGVYQADWSSRNYFAGNVGIGVSNPSNTLTAGLSSNITSQSTSAVLNIFNSDTTTNNMANIAFGQSGAGSNGFSRLGVIYTDRAGGSEDQDMFFGTIGGGAYSEKMRITSVGRVGIGTTNPLTELHIADSGQAYLTLQADTNNNETDTDAMLRYLIDGGTQKGVVGYDQGSDVMTLSYGADANNHFNINSVGNVGVGTTAPNDIFSIGNAGAAPAGSSNTGHNYTNTYLSSDDYALANYGLVKTLISAATSSSALWGGTTGGNIWSLNSANVGIGTTNPGSKLTVNGVGASSTPLSLLQVFNKIPYATGNGLGAARIEIGHGISHGYIEGAANSETNSGDGYMAFGTRRPANNVTEAMRINQYGNIGIGTTNPFEKLDLRDGNLYISDSDLATNGTGGSIKFGRPDGYGSNWIASIGSYATTGYDRLGLTFNTSFGVTQERMRLSPEGNIGIGTTNPTAILDIVSGGKFSSSTTAGSVKITPTTSVAANEYGSSLVLNVRRSSDYDGAAIASISDNNADWDAAGLAFLYHNSTNATNRIEAMRITPSGNIGIGTTAPNDIFSIGNAGTAPAGSSNTGHNYTNTYLSSDDYALANYGLVKTLISAATSSSALWGGTTGGNIWSLNSANVGIGTTNPGTTLDIRGSSTAGTPLNIYRDNNFVAVGVSFANQGYSSRSLGMTGGGNYYIGSTDGSQFTILSTSGNVGIGTTSPSRLLAVSGDALINGMTVGRGAGNSVYNTAVGYEALNSNSTNGYNTAVGYIALRSNGTGMGNVATGYAALSNNSSGGNNTAVGAQALGVVSTGSSNTAIGHQALLNVTSSNNIALGEQPGRYIADGVTNLTNPSSSIFIGNFTRALANGASNEIVIGNSITGIGSNSINIANTIYANNIHLANGGNVGIGTSAPNDNFSIGNAGAAPAGSSNTGHNYTNTYLSSDDYALANYGIVKTLIASATSSSALWGGTTGGNIWSLNSANVGIGTTTPAAKLHILTSYNNVFRFNDGASNITPNISIGGPSTKSVALLSGSSGSVFTFDNTGFFGIYTDSKANIDSGTSGGGVSRMVVTSAGNVGIGMTNPSALFHVGSSFPTIRFTQIDSSGQLISNFNNNGNSTPISIRNLDVTAGIAQSVTLQSYFGRTGDSTPREGGYLRFGKEQEWTSTASTNDSFISLGVMNNYSYNDAFRISATGNVGIGITNPNDILSIGNAGTAAPAGSSNTGHNYTNTYLSSDDYALANYGIVKTLIASATSTMTGLWGGAVGGNIWSLNGSGNVGIGTTTPGALLDVVGTVRADSFVGPLNGSVIADNVTNGFFGNNYGGGTYTFGGWPSLLGGGSSINFYLASTGSHIIHAPQLYVRQDDSETAIIDTKVALDIHNDDGGQNTYSTLAFSSREAAGAGNSVALAGISGWKISAGTANAWSQGGLKLWVKDNGVLNEAIIINQAGNVGIGNTNPVNLLSVKRNSALTTAMVRIGEDGSGDSNLLFANNATGFLMGMDNSDSDKFKIANNGTDLSTNTLFTMTTSGNVGIGTTDPGVFKLKVAGDVAITGALLTQTGSDFAEEFKAPTALEPGTVVVMGDEGYKSVKACENSYDKTVVGIVSDNPSIIAGRTDIDNKNPEKVIVAMMGVVKVKVTNSNGQISKGDLLTTSDMKGFAMRAKNSKQGTVIGKALEDLNTKTGEIKVLVNLQ